MNTTADIRDFLAKQMQVLAGLSDIDMSQEKDRAELQASIEVAKASAAIAAQYTQVVKVEIDAARTMGQFGVTTGSVALEDQRKQVGGRG